jgi:AhpD family alkylhydroperoxidase
MEARMTNPAMVPPGTMPAIQVQAPLKAAHAGGVPPTTQELVHLRASQINGCSFCLDMGARSARRPRWQPGGGRVVARVVGRRPPPRSSSFGEAAAAAPLA